MKLFYIVDSKAYNANDIYNDMINLGEEIENLARTEKKDLTKWENNKNKQKLLILNELEIFQTINNTDINIKVLKLIKKYNYYNNDINKYEFKPLNIEKSNYRMNKLIEKTELIDKEDAFKILCHYTYLISKIINNLNNKQKKNKIDFKTYFINFKIKKTELFTLKTINMIYDIINYLFKASYNSCISKDGKLIYYTYEISTIPFFYLYPKINSIQEKKFKTALFKECQVCHMPFIASRQSEKYCGSQECKKVKNIEYVLKSKKKNKS